MIKIIIIVGQSGSGKTTISNKLSKSLGDSFIINTDSYYRDDIIIKLLSMITNDIYDRLISIKKKEIIKTIGDIYSRKKSTSLYNYDFERKKSSRTKKSIQNINKIKYIIIEGIFAHRLGLNYKNTINIECKENKELCYKRRLKRDILERKRNEQEINIRFEKSWELYLNNSIKYIHSNNIEFLYPSNEISLIKIINTIKNYK